MSEIDAVYIIACAGMSALWLAASIDDAVQEIEGLTAAVNAAKAAQVEVGCVLRKKAAK